MAEPRAEKPLVSVVMPFLDPGPFLHEAIASVLAQTYGNWELLLVDDGSSDGSSETAKAYAELAPDRIRYLRHPNGDTLGMSASRNHGIRAAHGEVVALLDADDAMTRRKLNDQVAQLESHPEAAMVYGPTEWWYSWTGNEEDRDRDFIQDLGLTTDRVFEPPSLLVSLLRREHPTMTPALVRREALEQAGRFEESFRGLYEDQAACAKICLAHPVFVSSRCSYRWRQHPRSSCAVAVANGEHASAREAYLEWLASYLEANDVTDDEVWHALRDELSRIREPAAAAEGTGDRSPRRRIERVARDRARRILRRGDSHPRRRGGFELGDLDRETPVSRSWGYDRGTPIDRYYIESFLADHAAEIRGRVLEAGDDEYTRRFGGGNVEHADVLHVNAGNPKASIVADLASAPHLQDDAFDCIVLTQTFQFIFDVQSAVRTVHRILKPGGVVLATVPGISHIGADEWKESWYWRFTEGSMRALFAAPFGEKAVHVGAYGNVTTAVAFLHGLAVEDLGVDRFRGNDPSYDLIVAVRARKDA
jgi:glycosyltransferase involved in cell wall biosynthesis